MASEGPLIELYFHFILIWIMVDLWVLFINNFAYNTLKMNGESSYDNLIVAIFVTSCSLMLIGSGISLTSSDRPVRFPVGGVEPIEPPTTDIQIVYDFDKYFVKNKKRKKYSFILPKKKKYIQ